MFTLLLTLLVSDISQCLLELHLIPPVHVTPAAAEGCDIPAEGSEIVAAAATHLCQAVQAAHAVVGIPAPTKSELPLTPHRMRHCRQQQMQQPRERQLESPQQQLHERNSMPNVLASVFSAWMKSFLDNAQCDTSQTVAWRCTWRVDLSMSIVVLRLAALYVVS